MIKSMTGYGRTCVMIGDKEITVEIRSVNHKYFDFSPKVPRIYGYLEDRLKKLTAESVNRGKVDMFVGINCIGGPNNEVSLNDEILKSYLKALRKISDDYGVEYDVTVSGLSRYPDVFSVVAKEEDEDELWNNVKTVAQSALKSFDDMRQIEGERLYSDLKSRCEAIEKHLEVIEELSKKSVPEYKQKLLDRIAELMGDVKVDESRLMTEVAIMADKLATDEETVRLRSHIAQFYKMLESNEPIGRKMDFLIQEMNREINTTGSKANDLEIARIVVEVKSEIEKIREQVQNVE